MRTLYICYFGLREPLVQTQVLPYLRQLAAGGITVNLLSFEPNLPSSWTTDQLDEWTARLAAEGIRWFTLSYHKRPSAAATAYDVMKGVRFTRRLIRREGIDVLHARSHIPMLMAMLAQRGTSCRLVFDFRGLVADEYVDAGIWRPGSLPFRAMKRVERAGLCTADQVVVLTERMRDWIVEQGLTQPEKINVIPCCVDTARFDDAIDETPDAASFEVVYAGAATGLYLLEEMGHFVKVLRTRVPNAFFRVLTQSSQSGVADTLRRAGLSDSNFWIGSVAPQDVSGYLRKSRFGLSFRRPAFAQIAASPTKIPEYLAAGVPAISNRGVGDTDDLLSRERVGVLLEGFDEDHYRQAVDQMLALLSDPALRERCTRTAKKYFDLKNVGGARYRELYRKLNASEPKAEDSREY